MGVAANITSTTDGNAEDFTISLAGATDSSLILSSTGTGADALQINTSAGGIDITATGNAAGEDIDISSAASINLTATEDAANAILITANGGTSETIKIHSDQGTGAGSIELLSDVGGITLTGDTDHGVLVGTVSGAPISIGHTTSETTVNDNLVVTGNITANGNIIGDDGTSISNISTIYLDSIEGDTKIDLTGTTLNIDVGGNTFLETTGTTAKFSTNITASGNISASGDVIADQIKAGGRVYPNFTLSSAHFLRNTTVSNPMLSAVGGFHVDGHVTASGNISGSSTSNLTIGGTVTAEHIASTDDMTVAGDLDVAGEIECDHLNIADIDDGIHFDNIPVLFIDGDTNVNLGVDGASAVDLELYGHNHTLTAGAAITLDAVEDINFDSATGNINFKDSGTTQLSLDMDGTAGAQVIQLKVAGDDLIFKSQGGDALITLKSEGQTEIHGNITASGNISASGTISGQVGLIRHNITSDTATDAKGDVVYFGSGDGLDAGKIHHYKSDGSWEIANATAVATSNGLLGVALETAPSGGMLLRGMVTLDHDPGTTGQPLYLDTGNNGQAIHTISSTNNHIVRVIGYCLDDDDGQIWFNPDSTFVEITA